MGYRSDVKILMGNKAYNVLEMNCLESENDYVKEMVQKPSTLVKNDDDFVLIGWDYVKWYDSYEDVRAVLNTLKKLDEIVEEDEEMLKDYYYKMIEIGEDNHTSITTNDYDEEFVSDFYVECTFSL